MSVSVKRASKKDNNAVKDVQALRFEVHEVGDFQGTGTRNVIPHERVPRVGVGVASK